MSIVLLGVNHKTAPLDLRERLAIAPERLESALRSLTARPGIREALILSTCNRVEILASHQSPNPLVLSDIPDSLQAFVHEYFSVEPATLKPHLYHYREEEAVRHIFRVAASLDSMVVGEPQILGQVKESYTVARAAGAVQSDLEKLLQSAFTVAKKIRSTTNIGAASVSIASVAVELAQKIFGSLDGKRVLIVGAGKMSELAARHLIEQGANSILVANRTHERAVRLAEGYGGSAIPFADLASVAHQADIVLTSTGSPQPIFLREDGQRFLQRRRNRPMFFIDIAVPRDVDPEMNKVDGIFLYDIDDLQSVAASHMEGRNHEAELAEQMIAEEVERFQRRIHSLGAVPAILEMQQNAEEIRQAELRRVASRLSTLTDAQREAVEALTRGLMNKFLHPPLQAIKAAAGQDDAAGVETIRNAFTPGYAHLRQAANDASREAAPPRSASAKEAATKREDLP